MRTYIFIFAIANIVAGGPIYNRNKIKYLEERGWNVIVFPTNTGDIYIKGLEKYKHEYYSFFHDRPAEYTDKERQLLLNRLIERIPVAESSEIIIETGTDFTALWGEILAARIKAKHFIMFLDEKNPNVNNITLPFFEFKYHRHELACITKRTMQKMFEGYMRISDNEAYGLKACCSNVVEDYDSDIVNDLPKGDYVIGSIGRLDKAFVPNIIDGVLGFAQLVFPKVVCVYFFGGADKDIENSILKKMLQVSNIRVYISGYIFPIPLKAIRKCDVFVSGAGSARASAQYQIPTVRMDIYDWCPAGIITNVDKNTLESCKYGTDLVAYLKQILIYKELPEIQYYPINEEWNNYCAEFDKHMSFVNLSDKINKYYATEKIPVKSKVKTAMRKCLRIIVGLNHVESMRLFYRKYFT